MNNDQPTRMASSVLQSLRSLIPQRTITFMEALRIAEIQAARLLQLLDITDYPVLSEVITELPKTRIEYVAELPSFGLSFWNGEAWIIQLSTRQSRARQRFTLFHEYKHVIDHGATDRLYTNLRQRNQKSEAEQAADFFAGCALIPRRALKSAWGQGIQNSNQLAEYFDTSAQAIDVRLAQTGLWDSVQRCAAASDDGRRLIQIGATQ